VVVRRFAWNPCQSGIKCPFHRLLAVVGNRGERSKKRVRFESSNDDTRLFTVPLTDVKIRQAKAGNKPTKLTNGNGLYLLVNPSGSRLWRYKYRIAGNENLSAIGDYPTLSRQDARTARDDARELVKKGLHPSHARQEVLSARINEGKATRSSRPGGHFPTDEAATKLIWLAVRTSLQIGAAPLLIGRLP